MSAVAEQAASISLMPHQGEFDLACRRGMARHLLQWDCGVGKTIAVLSAVNSTYNGRVVVVCPRSVMRAAWEADAKHFPLLNVKVLWSEKPKTLKANIEDPTWAVGVINFDAFRTYYPQLFAVGIDTLVVDESSKIKNPASQITKVVWGFADRVRRVFLLSGTPAPNCKTEYYGQLRALGRDAVDGLGPIAWTNKYFVARRQPTWIKVRGQAKKVDKVVGYYQTEHQRKVFEELLSRYVWVLRKEDVAGFPEKADIVVPVELSKREQAAYAAVRDELRIVSGDGDASRIVAEAALQKMRQVTGGGVLVDGKPETIGSSKIDAALDIIDSLGSEPVVVWAEYSHEIDRLMDAIADTGRSVARLDGSTSGEAGSIVERFQRGEIDVLVCQPQAAGHGVTLTRACYAVYFSLSFSYELYHQSRDRIHRTGQKRKCVYYHLIAPDTVDESCLRVVQRKKSAAEAVRDMLAEARK